MLQHLLVEVKKAIFEDPSIPHREKYDPSGLIGRLESLFGRHEAILISGSGIHSDLIDSALEHSEITDVAAGGTDSAVVGDRRDLELDRFAA